MPRPPLTAEQTAETRSALLDVAQSLYEEAGTEGMSFRSIATRHGCSSAMPYSYFDSKADLVDGLRLRAYGWIRDVLVTAASAAPEPLSALRAIAEAYVRAGVDRPRMYELLYSRDGAMPETDPRLTEVKNAALGVCRQVIEAAVAAGGVTLATDAETAAHLFWSSAHGLVSLELGGFLVVGRSMDELLEPLFAALVTGLTEVES